MDATGANFTTGDSITIKGSAELKNDDRTSLSCTDAEIVEGNFSPVEVSGIVRDTNTSPVSGITVIVTQGETTLETETDGSGVYTFRLAPGVYNIDVNEDYYIRTNPDSSSVTVPNNTTYNYPITVTSTGSITGTLTMVVSPSSLTYPYYGNTVIQASFLEDTNPGSFTVSTPGQFTNNQVFTMNHLVTGEEYLYFHLNHNDGTEWIYIGGTGHTLAEGVMLVSPGALTTPFVGSQIDEGGSLYIRLAIQPGATTNVGKVNLLYQRYPYE